MNRIATLAAISAAVSVFAAAAPSAVAAEQTGAVTRAQVTAELKSARASGDLQRAFGENGDYSSTELPKTSGVSRADVNRDIVRAKQAGRLNEAFLESPSDGTSVASRQPLTRQEVRAELNRARRSGELARINSNDSHD